MGRWKVWRGDCVELMGRMPSNKVDALVTDPPAGISFMGKTWDTPKSYGFSTGHQGPTAPTVNLSRNPTCRVCGGRRRAGAATRPCSCEVPNFNDAVLRVRDRAAFVHALTPIFAECLRVLKPGAWGLVWALPRTAHWTTTALEDAGFEIRDVLLHLFGTGFPKGTDKAKIPEAWQGWNTALKPASEHWVLVRKPLGGALAQNLEQYGTGALNIDGCKVATGEDLNGGAYGRNGLSRRCGLAGDDRIGASAGMFQAGGGRVGSDYKQPKGRWPANVTLDEEAAALLDAQSGTLASRFFYVAKPSRKERDLGCDRLPTMSASKVTGRKAGSAGLDSPRAGAGRTSGARNHHPTVKSIALMRWLVRLITPPGGLVLDPFMGSGTTGLAVLKEHGRFWGVEREKPYFKIALARLRHAKHKEHK